MNTRIVALLLLLIVALAVIGLFVPSQAERLYSIVAQVVTGMFAYLQAKAETKP